MKEKFKTVILVVLIALSLYQSYLPLPIANLISTRSARTSTSKPNGSVNRKRAGTTRVPYRNDFALKRRTTHGALSGFSILQSGLRYKIR